MTLTSEPTSFWEAVPLLPYVALGPDDRFVPTQVLSLREAAGGSPPILYANYHGRGEREGSQVAIYQWDRPIVDRSRAAVRYRSVAGRMAEYLVGETYRRRLRTRSVRLERQGTFVLMISDLTHESLAEVADALRPISVAFEWDGN